MAKVATKDELLATLRDLGDEPVDVALALERADITGLRDEPQQCPIANYLVRCFPDASPLVDRSQVTLLYPKLRDGVKVPTPRPVECFIGEFDNGGHPGLDRRFYDDCFYDD